MNFSFLDVISELRGDNISRVVYCGQRKPSSSTSAVASNIESLIASFQRDGAITGLAIIQEQSIFNLIEGPTEVVYSLLKTISDAANTKDYPVDKLKIVGSSDDVPARVFGSWACRIMNTSKENDVDIEQEGATNAAATVFVNFVKIGSSNAYGAGMDPVSNKSVLEGLNRSVPDLLPSNERCVAMCNNDKIPSLDSFTRLYQAPLDPQSDAELVWPLQTSLPTWLLEKLA